MTRRTESRLQQALSKAPGHGAAGSPAHTLIGPGGIRPGRIRLRRLRRPARLPRRRRHRLGILRRLEHVPIATAVRLPNADPAPIGRVLDAGADAIIVAMIESAEQAAAAVAATRYPPTGVRSFGPLRASLGARYQPSWSHGSSVFAMIETAAALADVDEICAVAGPAGVYVGPADLAISLGVGVVRRDPDPAVRDAIVRHPRAATDAGLVTGIHAGDGKIGHAMARMGFRMITLARNRRRCAAALPRTCARRPSSDRRSRRHPRTDHRLRARPGRGRHRQPRGAAMNQRVALVTGAARGQGWAIANGCATTGFRWRPATSRRLNCAPSVDELGDDDGDRDHLDVTSPVRVGAAVRTRRRSVRVADHAGQQRRRAAPRVAGRRDRRRASKQPGGSTVWAPSSASGRPWGSCGRPTAPPSSTPAAPGRSGRSRTTPPTARRSGRCGG